MKDKQKLHPVRVVVQVLVFVVLVPFLPLLISGQWDWWEAWVYALLAIGGFVISRALAARRHPDLLAERARFLDHENAKSWDRILASLVGLGGALLPVTAGLEARAGGGPEFGLAVKMVALAAIVAGYALGTYALMENRFFSGMVRIQADRGHHVVSSGPYGWLRHPGYAGALLTYWASPVWLDSRWAFLAAAFLTVVLVIRTALEDRTLQEELAGYGEYARRVRYRLVPGVW
jgi:protein-S-isoprenylcysteine O-methyltransferase Ste14